MFLNDVKNWGDKTFSKKHMDSAGHSTLTFLGNAKNSIGKETSTVWNGLTGAVGGTVNSIMILAFGGLIIVALINAMITKKPSVQ
jgi:hypothetical protein